LCEIPIAAYHFSMKPVARSSGRSSVAAAAYRTGTELVNQHDGLVHDYTNRSDVLLAEIVLPSGVDAPWALDRERLWNAAEAAEVRKDARTAREYEFSLPHELSADARARLTRAFAQHVADRFGVAVDAAIHAPHREGDQRNFHVHLLATTRVVHADGLGGKSTIERQNRALLDADLPTSAMQLRMLRADWADFANRALVLEGFDAVLDHRSFADRGIALLPTEHVGVAATQMARKGESVERVALGDAAAELNAFVLQENPTLILALVANEKSVFDRQDVARALDRYVNDPAVFTSVFTQVMASAELVELVPEIRRGGEVLALARYSTQDMVTLERDMAGRAVRLAASGRFGVADWDLQAALAARPFLAEEQRVAVGHLTGESRLAVAVGLAGAGKSTMLAAARAAWEASGYRVHGAALAGKAAEGLAVSSGIASRTLASWALDWDKGRAQLGPRDVLVIDEAGMVSSRQLAQFVAAVDQAGAKLVLVGDPEQLQPIEAGAAFRAVAERVGYVELEGVRRQRDAWQREASVDFARGRTGDGLAAYAGQGDVVFDATAEAAVAAIAGRVVADRAARPDGSRLALAHRRVDVAAINAAVRGLRQAQGELVDERVYATESGKRAFAVGDRVVFGKNDRGLDVKNGLLGTIEGLDAEWLRVRVDAESGAGRVVTVPIADYGHVDHGYATTVHKSQGSTVDRAFVLASGSMDRHLMYVAMTRHRDGVELHVDGTELKDLTSLTASVSRSGLKETTLDYEKGGYAVRRGLSGDFVVPARTSAASAPELQAVAAKGMADFRAQFAQHQAAAAERAARQAREAVLQAERAAQQQAERDRVQALERERQAALAAVRTPKKSRGYDGPGLG
jgi:Ti-type conjugative transfer relaxase TraA